MNDKELSAFLNVPLKVQIGGKDYELHQLTLDDFAKAEQHIREQRLQTYLDFTRPVNGVNLPEGVRARAMADIVSKEVNFYEDVLVGFEGQLFVIYLSVLKGDPNLTYESMRVNIAPDTVNTIFRLVSRITGLFKEKGAGDAKTPLGTKNSTSTTQETMPE